MRPRLITTIAMVAALALSACAGDPTADPTDGPDPTGGATTDPSDPASLVGTLDISDAQVSADGPPADLHADATHVLTVNLRPGIEWSDGTPLTAADFVGGYEIMWAQQSPIWQSLVAVSAADDTTLVFQTNTLSGAIVRDLIRWNQTTSRSQYGEFYDRIRQLREGGAEPDDAEVQAVLEDLEAFQPAETIAYGPYVVDPATVSVQQLNMPKNPRGYNADVIGFDEIIVYWGSTQETVPLILSDQIDYTTDPLSPADEQAVAAKDNVELIRTPMSVGTGIWFNQSVEPFDVTELRQAIAHVVDRERNATVSLGASARPIEFMAGFTDNMVDPWLPADAQGRLNRYENDHDQAAALLEGAGFERDSNGQWTDPSGDPVAFEIIAPTEFTDFLASARDVSEQLNDFGFDTSVRGVPAASRPELIEQADYEVMLDFSLITTPNHPHASLSWSMSFGFWGNNNPEAPDGSPKGMNFPWNQQLADGTEVYIPDLLDESIAGFDQAAQVGAVVQLAEVFNTQLPVVPLYERYTNDPSAHGPRVEGWLAQDHAVYANNVGSDNYASIQLLQGTLQPIDGADGTFRTAARYLQPPNLSYNVYAREILYGSLTPPAYDVSFPPLFWFSDAEQVYFPSVGASYSIYEVP